MRYESLLLSPLSPQQSYQEHHIPAHPPIWPEGIVPGMSVPSVPVLYGYGQEEAPTHVPLIYALLANNTSTELTSEIPGKPLH